MNIQEQLRSYRGGIGPRGPYMAPLIIPNPRQFEIEQRRLYLKDAQSRDNTVTERSPLPPIPEADLLILTKIYHRRYEDCGRKRGALLRYIDHYRKEEPVNHSTRLFKHIEKVVRRLR